MSKPLLDFEQVRHARGITIQAIEKQSGVPAVQAGVEVAFEQHVSIVVSVQENEEPTVQQGSETWTRAH